MSFPRIALIPILVLAATTLAGCTFSASLTVPASSVAKAAAGALEKQVGSRPDIDCGKGDVKLIDGTKVKCELTDPSTKSVFGATVTISDVKGTDYRVNVKVDSTPKSGTTTPSASPSATPSTIPTDTVTVYDYEVAKVAAGALEQKFGARPTVICASEAAGGKIALKDGETVNCTVIEAKTGKRYKGVATIGGVQGTAYTVNIQIKAE